MSDDPVKARSWPSTLPARVVESGDAPRLQGYDVASDLARNYSFGEIILLSLSGELPSEAQARLFERILVLLSPAWAGSAPAHAASLSRLCGASDAAVFGTCAALLTEAVGSTQATHLAWENDSLKKALAEAMSELGHEPAWTDEATASEAISKALSACGLQKDWQKVAAQTIAALPAAMAEARAWERGGYDGYPLDLPAFRYEEDGDG